MFKAGDTEYSYKLKEGDTYHELSYTEEEKDLGVVIDGKLDFDRHINIKINKASSIMAVIRRSFVSLNGVNFVPLYKSLVRSHLEYHMPHVYGHHIRKSISKLLKECREEPLSNFPA